MHPWRLRAALGIGALIIALAYLFPQILFHIRNQETRFGRHAVYLQVDEPFYAARLARALQGDYGHNPWLYEHRDRPVLVPTFPEWCIAQLRHLLPLTVDGGVVFSRVLFPSVSFLVFFFALKFLGLGTDLAVFAALWVFLEPGLLHYKPFGGLLMQYDYLPLSRFSNPLFGMTLFMAAWFAGARAYLGAKKQVLWALLAGVLTGLTFHVSTYYWTHLALAFLFAALAIPSPHRWRVLLVGFASALVVSIPYWMSYLELNRLPVSQHLAWRNGLLIKDRGFHLLKHKALWCFIAASIPLQFNKELDRLKVRYLLVSVIAGLACLFSSLLTGVGFQNFHWHYTIAPLLFASTMWSAWCIARRHLPSRLILSLAGLALLPLVFSSFKVGWDCMERLKRDQASGVGFSDAEYFDAWDWLRAHAPAETVVMADPRTMATIPARIGRFAWTDSHISAEPVPFEEILERNQVVWALEGVTPEKLEGRLKPPAALAVALWASGLTTPLLNELLQRGRPPFDREIHLWLSTRIAEEQSRLSPKNIARIGSKYRLDYLVRGPNEAHWGSQPDRLLDLEAVARTGGIRIDRVIGWKTR